MRTQCSPAESPNPYQPPNADDKLGLKTSDGDRPGKRCPACGGENIRRDDLLKCRPSVLWVLLFGWIFLLIRGAFALRTARCGDCGRDFRYKSVGSWIALCVLIFIVLSVVTAMLDSGIE